MTEQKGDRRLDHAPGGHKEGAARLSTYLAGLGLALLLTVASFALVGSGAVWAPAIPILLAVLAVAQMGVHLVFFLHITSGPENTNNTLALAFGVMIVALTVGGTLWIMAHLDHNMMPMAAMAAMAKP